MSPRRSEAGTHCGDCDSVVVADTGDVENYLVSDEVWGDAGMDPSGGFLCVECIESRLGRGLIGADLPTDVPINYPGMQRDTPRIYQLKSDAWRLTASGAAQKGGHQ